MIFFRSSIFLLAYLFSQSGYEIAEKMSLKPYPKDVTAKLIMTLEDKRGNQMESTIKSYTKDNGKNKSCGFFHLLQIEEYLYIKLKKAIRMK